MTTIIQTSANRFYRVWDCPGLDHVWNGVEVKRVCRAANPAKDVWVDKKNARQELVRKAATHVVSLNAEYGA